MKVVILAGGLGTRLSEETSLKPKPMVEIGGMPILWHIMKIYSSYGFNDFVICLGYKGYLIKEFFSNYFVHKSDITVNLVDNSIEIHDNFAEDWKVTLVDTGLQTQTGGRIKKVRKYLDDKPFMLTYGDGVSDVDISKLLRHHQKMGKICTVTTVKPAGRFGALNLENNGIVHSFIEKPKGDGSWINGGFFVCEQKVFEYIENDDTVWERSPMEILASLGEMAAFKHEGYWKPMDTLRDKQELESEWINENAKWKKW
jgi:glucose-1-phosphate cytidylyltransferase